MVVLKCKTNNRFCHGLRQKDKYIWLRFLCEPSTFRISKNSIEYQSCVGAALLWDHAMLQVALQTKTTSYGWRAAALGTLQGSSVRLKG